MPIGNNQAINFFQPLIPKPSSMGHDVHREGQHQASTAFIAFPSVSDFNQLCTHGDFQAIKEGFLSDIKTLKQEAAIYTENTHNEALEKFHHQIKKEASSDREHSGRQYSDDDLLKLFRDVRLRIHTLVSQLKERADTINNVENSTMKRTIIRVLTDCLEGADLCADAVLSRFRTHFLLDGQESLNASLYQIRYKLYDGLVKRFLTTQAYFTNERDMGITMERHHYNSIYNIHCKAMGLAPIDDRYASNTLPDAIQKLFRSEVGFHVNKATILKELSSEWYEKIKTAFTNENALQLLTQDTFTEEEYNMGTFDTINSNVFNPLNDLLNTKEVVVKIFDFIQHNEDYTICSLKYLDEQIHGFLANHFSSPCEREALVKIPSTNRYIGTIDDLFFWT
ncbi:hypothetical protein, partial [Photobacterium leiognathi]